MKPTTNGPRNRDLAALHIAAQACGLDTADQNPDSEYRSLLWTLGRQRSAAALDFAGRRAVLDHLRARAGNPLAGNEWAWANSVPEARKVKIWKIRRLCKEIGIAHGQQIAYAEGVARRVLGIERHLRMMDPGELWRLIGPLEKTLAAKRGNVELRGASSSAAQRPVERSGTNLSAGLGGADIGDSK